MTIKRNSDAGKALVKALGDGSRVVVDMASLESKLASVSAVVGDTIPVLYAGGSIESVQEAGTDQAIVGLVAQQRKDDGAKQAETHYTSVLVTPLFSIETLVADSAGRDWVEKIIEKETAHVSFRPIRNAEDGESLEDYATRVPATLSNLVTAAARDKIDTEAVTILWPMFRSVIQEMSKGADEDGKAAKAALAFLPGAKAIATVSKAIRSADWARRNTPELEVGGFWSYAAQSMIEGAKEPLPDPENPGDHIEVDASTIAKWHAGRDEEIIEPPVTRAPKDVAGLETFLARMTG